MQAGLRAVDGVVSVGGQATPTWEQASLGLLEAALGSGQAEVTVRTAQDIQRQVTLQVPPGKDLTGPGKLLPGLGISEYRPKVPPVLGQLVPGGPAAKSGLKGGDRIAAVAGTPSESAHDRAPIGVAIGPMDGASAVRSGTCCFRPSARALASPERSSEW